jgi:hypothetical protein
MRLYEDDLMSQRHEKMLNQITKLSKWILMQMQVDFEDIEISFNSSISYTVDELIDKSKARVELYNSLKGLGIYDEIMIAQELRDSQDELIFGTALTEEKMEELREKFQPKIDKENEETQEEGESDSQEDENFDFPDLNEGETIGGEEEIPLTTDELDLTEDFVELTDLGTEDLPEPTGGNE